MLALHPSTSSIFTQCFVKKAYFLRKTSGRFTCKTCETEWQLTNWNFFCQPVSNARETEHVRMSHMFVTLL